MDKKMIGEILKNNEEFINSIWQKKYFLENETSVDDVRKRFEKTLQNHLKENKSKMIFTTPEKFVSETLFNTFIPGGSILFGFGNPANVSMSNCYYLHIRHDTLEAIGQTLTENMRTFSWRGGVGNTFEVLRPKGDKVNNAAKTSTGSVSFMPLFSLATQTIGQNGRRGASIFTHAIWHPDVVDFIISKAFPEKVFERNKTTNELPSISGANISVKITDSFMRAVKNDEMWQFVFPDMDKVPSDIYDVQWNGDIDEWVAKGYPVKFFNKMRARDLFRMIAEGAWTYAEPGVVFWDNIINNTPMAVIPKLKPRGLNPCGEQILPDGGSCNLGSLVLHRFVKNPYTEKAEFDWKQFTETIKQAVEFMDIVIDMNKHPLEIQKEIDQYGRKIGLGITGLGDMLAMLGYKYGSKEALEFTEQLMVYKAYIETLTSIELAKEKGSCPVFYDVDADIWNEYAEHKYWKQIDEKARELHITPADFPTISTLLKEHGIRNIGLSTVAPNGSISILMDTCTSGVEPLFSFEYYRKSNLFNEPIRIIHPPLFTWLAKNRPEDLDLSKDELLEKYNYVEAHQLDWKQRIDMQSVLQKYTTDSISSTVNLPNETTVEEVEQIYEYAWERNLKGVTVYRAGCALEGILKTSDEASKIKEEQDEFYTIWKQHKENKVFESVELPSEYPMQGYKLKAEGKKWYLHVAFKDKKKKRPFAIFVTTNHPEPTILTNNALQVLEDLARKEGIPEDKIEKNKKKMAGQNNVNKLARSLGLLLRHNVPIKDIVEALDTVENIPVGSFLFRIKKFLSEFIEDGETSANKCPECGSQLIYSEGCLKCPNCGWSKCG